ncbi:MAG: hypothetical protein EHM24_08970 [Acidobacteria bacterium]|nr:MAG: hypothetical protein EHM24_08970 [Acidobacteriota bacterium]
MALRTVGLAVVCFVFGVVSTMFWLRPPANAGWLLRDRPLAVAVALVFVLIAGALAGLVISKRIGRLKSN